MTQLLPLTVMQPALMPNRETTMITLAYGPFCEVIDGFQRIVVSDEENRIWIAPRFAYDFPNNMLMGPYKDVDEAVVFLKLKADV